MRQTFIILAAFALGAFAQAATVKVVDHHGQALAGVEVLVGPAIDQPFPDNRFTTDENGNFPVPAAWNRPLPVTLQGRDLVRTTHVAALPDVGQLTISQSDGNEKIEISGTLSDYGNVRTDGKIDAGAFIPALPRNQLLYFDVGWLLSPEFDVLSVLGRELAIPSNLTLPNQQENYIFPITLNKPNFRMYVRKPGQYRFLAVHGQFPLKRVVDDFRSGTPAYNIINHGTLLQSGIVDLNVSGPINELQISVNTTPFVGELTLQPPPMAPDDVILSVALSEDGGSLLPSDVKRLRSNQSQVLKAPVNKGVPYTLSLWFKERANLNFVPSRHLPSVSLDTLDLPFDLLYDFFQDRLKIQAAAVNFKQVSLALQNATGQPPQFISHIEPPRITGSRVDLRPPVATGNIRPLATLLIYSSIQKNRAGKIETEQRTRLWEVWQPGWVNAVDLPSLPSPVRSAADKLRWEVLYLGQDGQDITHVSRNAIEL